MNNRYTKFSADERAKIEALLWISCKTNPVAKTKRHTQLIKEAGWDVNESYIRRIFQRWNWNYKKPTVQQIQKFTAMNLYYYVRYTSWVFFIPYQHLKFLDESHIAHKEVANKYGIGEVGERVILVDKRVCCESEKSNNSSTLIRDTA